MELDLKNRLALVCGSSQGIGSGIARCLAAEGATLILVARNSDKIDHLLSSLPGSGHKKIVTDFQDPKSVDQLCIEIAAEPIEIVINNTGGPAPGSLVDATIDQFENAVKMHLHASHKIMQTVLPGMKSGKYGRFINVISTSVKMPIAGLGVSNTTRGAMSSWAKTLSMEVGAFGITVNNILPGAIDTDRLDTIFQKQGENQNIAKEKARENMIQSIPSKRIGEPEEMGNLACFLASPKASYINGVNIPVDGGRTGSLP